jgi:hypothetical protein
MLLAFLLGTESDFLDFPGEHALTGGQNCQLAKSSETTVQKNSLRGHDPQAVSVPQLLRGTSGTQLPEMVQKDCTNEGSSPDTNGVNYARPLKITKAERFLKEALMHVL